MAHPHDPARRGQQPPQYGAPPARPPAVYGQPQPPAVYGPPPGYGYPVQQPMAVRQVGRSVTKPAWTLGQILLVLCSAGTL